MMSVQASVTNHAAVYVGDNIILHHLFGHLSSRTPYGKYYRDRTVGWSGIRIECMVKTLILEGKMAKKFGKRIQFDVADLREMLRAMCSQVPGFKKYMSEAHMKGIRFAFFNGDNNIGLEEFDMTRGGSVYRIVPVYEGAKSSGVLQIVVGAVALVAAFFTAGCEYGSLGGGDECNSHQRHVNFDRVGVSMMLVCCPDAHAPAILRRG
nr:hypothetical protein [Enterobacter asburiae]